MGTASGDIRNAHRELTQEVDRVLCDQEPQVIEGALNLLAEMSSSSLPLSQQLKCLRERKWSPLLSSRSNTPSPASIPSSASGEFSSSPSLFQPIRPTERADPNRSSPLRSFAALAPPTSALGGSDQASSRADGSTASSSSIRETPLAAYDVAEQLMLAFSRFSHPLEEEMKVSSPLESSLQEASLRDQEARKLFQSLGFETQEEYFSKVATQGYYDRLSKNLTLTFDAMPSYVSAMAISLPKPLPPHPIGTRQAPGTVVVKLRDYLNGCDREALLERQNLLEKRGEDAWEEGMREHLLRPLEEILAHFDLAIIALEGETSSVLKDQIEQLQQELAQLEAIENKLQQELEELCEEIKKKGEESAASPLKEKEREIASQIKKIAPVIESARLQAGKKIWVHTLIDQFYEKPQRTHFSPNLAERALQWEEIAGRLEVVFDERSLESEGLSMLFAPGSSGLEGVTQVCFNGCIERVQALSSTKGSDGPAAFALFSALSQRREAALGAALKELFLALLGRDASREDQMNVHHLALMRQLLNKPYKLCYTPRELGELERQSLEVINGRAQNDPNFKPEKIWKAVLEKEYHAQSVLKHLKAQFSKLEPSAREGLVHDTSRAFVALLRTQRVEGEAQATALELVPAFDEVQLSKSVLEANELPVQERLSALERLHTAFIEQDHVPPFSMSCKAHQDRAKESLESMLENFKEAPELGRICKVAQNFGSYRQAIRYLEQQLSHNKPNEEAKGKSIIPKFQESLNQHKKEVEEDSASTQTVNDHQEEVREAVQQHLERLEKKTAADDPSYYSANRAAFEKLISRFPLPNREGKSAPGLELTDFGAGVLAISGGLMEPIADQSRPTLIAQKVGRFIYEQFSSPQQVKEKLQGGEIDLVRFLPRDILELPEMAQILSNDPRGAEMVLITLDEKIWSLETIPEDLLLKTGALKRLVSQGALLNERSWGLVQESEELLGLAIDRGYLGPRYYLERSLPRKLIESDELLLKFIGKYPGGAEVAIKELSEARLQQDGLIWKLSKQLYTPIEEILGKEKYDAIKPELLKQIVQDHDCFLYAQPSQLRRAIPHDFDVKLLLKEANALGKDAGFILAGLHQGYFDLSKHDLQQLLEKAQTQGDLQLAGKALFHLLDQFERFEGTSIQGLLSDREFQRGFVRGADDREALADRRVDPQTFIEKAIELDYLDREAFDDALHWLERPGVVLKLLEKGKMSFSQVDSSLRNDPQFLLRCIQEVNPQYFDGLEKEHQRAVIDCFISSAESDSRRRLVDYYGEILSKTEGTTFKGRLMEHPRAALILIQGRFIDPYELPHKVIDGCSNWELAFALLRADIGYFPRLHPSLQENPIFLAKPLLTAQEGLFEMLTPQMQRACTDHIVKAAKGISPNEYKVLGYALRAHPSLFKYITSESDFAASLCSQGLLLWNEIDESLRKNRDFVTSDQRVYEVAKSYAATHPQETQYALGAAMDWAAIKKHGSKLFERCQAAIDFDDLIPHVLADILAIGPEEEGSQGKLVDLLGSLPRGWAEKLRTGTDFSRVREHLNQNASCAFYALEVGLLKIEEVEEELLRLIVTGEPPADDGNESWAKQALVLLHDRDSACWNDKSFTANVHARDLLLFALDNDRLSLEDLSDEDLQKEGVLEKVAKLMPGGLAHRLFITDSEGNQTLPQALASSNGGKTLEELTAELSFGNLAFFEALPDENFKKKIICDVTLKILTDREPKKALSSALKQSASFKDCFFQDQDSVGYATFYGALDPALVPPEVFDGEEGAGGSLWYISSLIQMKIPQAFTYAGERRSDRVWFKKFNKTPKLLMYADEALRKDHEFVREICQGDPEFLKYADEALREDHDFVISLVLANPLTCQYAAPHLPEDESFLAKLNSEIEKLDEEQQERVRGVLLRAL